ncbi:MAG: hypothetical protein PF541_00545 [Prolixibacteraceae bacterium]|jgi:transcription elongation GreA/GreB family factor|nr:hypothetical protein [Prolixibacteraceae bacterium]
MNTKQAILDQLISILSNKAEVLVDSISSSKESRNNDTKSSAGDKFETGREMIQAEINKNEVLLSKSIRQIDDLKKIETNNSNSIVGFGSLVITNTGNYLLSIAMGKIKLNDADYYAISLASPIGIILNNHKVGDKLLFNKRELEILEIY